MRKVFSVLIFPALLLCGTCLAGQDTIGWYHAHFPPSTIVEGELKGQGYNNYLEGVLRDGLPEYEHTYYSANYSRILRQLKIKNGCSAVLIKTSEREKFLAYSQPTMVIIPNGVNVLRSRVKEFSPYVDEQGYISVVKLFYDSYFRMGVSSGRRYGGAVDAILKKNPNSPKIVVHQKQNVFGDLMRAMRVGRTVDYVIGMPHEIQWLIQNGVAEDEFAFFPIKEMPKYILSHVGCSKNEWGKEVIGKVDGILGGTYNTEHKRRYQEYLPTEVIELHERYLKEVFPVQEIE